MLSIRYNSKSKGVSSVGHYRVGLTNLETHKTSLPDEVLQAYNKSPFWSKAFGTITKNMSCYKLQHSFIVDND